MMLSILIVVAGYLLGSVSTAVLAGRLFGLGDPRDTGSGNPGATNMLRLGGKKAGAVTLLGDMAKGLVAVLLARYLGADNSIQAATGLAAFLGHLFPVFFGFKGGKGVATALGVALGLGWWLGLAMLGIWLVAAFITRISSAGALAAASASPLLAWWLDMGPATIIAMLVMTLLLIWRHAENIRRLMDGTEGRIKLGGGE